MKIKIFKLLEKGLIIWIFVVLIFGLYLQIEAENDGKLNHAKSYASMNIPIHSWVAYAFWIPIDVESYKYEAEWDSNQRLSSTDWISRIIFIILFISYWFIFILYKSSPLDKNKIAFLLILLFMNTWLFIETVYLLYLKVL